MNDTEIRRALRRMTRRQKATASGLLRSYVGLRSIMFTGAENTALVEFNCGTYRVTPDGASAWLCGPERA